LNEKVGYQFCR